jgi:hypothetical protein
VPQASIRGEESEQIELLNIRPETPEEYALSRPDGLREAILVVTAFLLFYCSLMTPNVFSPGYWAAGCFSCLRAYGVFTPPT